MKNGPHPVAVLGLPISNVTVDDAVENLERMIVSGGAHRVCSMNLDTWLCAIANPHLHRIMAGLSMILPDGMQLNLASRILGCPLERLSAADVMQGLAELSAQKGYKIFLLGASAGLTSRVRESMEQTHPGARIVGMYAPLEGNSALIDRGKILRRIHSAQPDILLVDSGDPKQEEWIWMHRDRLGVPLTVGVAGSFNLFATEVRRPPRRMQRSSLEWLMQDAVDPVSKWTQPLRNFFRLLRQLPLAFFAARCQRTFLSESRVTTAVAQRVMHLHIYGRLGAESSAALQEATTATILNGLAMVVHLRSARQLTAEGFGVLLETRRQLLQAGLSLSLAGLNLKTRFLLRAWRLERLFDEWQPEIPHKRPWAPVAVLPGRIALGGEHSLL